ncbi:MAG: hypothetical protein WCB27_15625 [Thermoguttaceae bacterium]
MDCSISENGVQEISLLESLEGEWIKLPLKIMRDVGPAAQTMGGILKMTNRETYSSVTKIAHRVWLPMATARKHLLRLAANGWIKNRGREHTRRGAPRRTATIVLTSKATTAAAEYGVLPWWACCSIRKVGKLPWSAKAVLSVVMARLMSLKAAAEREGNCAGDDDLIGAIANMGDEDRFRFSLTWLVRQTGLTHDSVTSAKRHLHELGIVDWAGGSREDGGMATDLLTPRWDFRIVITPASAGRYFLDFWRGAKSGQ